MAVVRIIVGLVFVVAGSVAIFDRDLDEGAWWLLAAAAVIAGVLGLISALRP